MHIEAAKAHLKRHKIPQYLNAWIKCILTKHRYEHQCRFYGTSSILTNPEAIINLGDRLWKAQHINIADCESRPRVLWVGTDYEQDRSGILQALDKVSELTIFHNSQNTYGQLQPRAVTEIENFRQLNGQQLMWYIKEADKKAPFDILIGQMWGYKMHPAALEVARKKGIDVVNISMDDRHAFARPSLADGTPGGTLGLVPYLSLACTDAPECVEWYQAEGCKAIYLPEASDPEIFHPMPMPKLYDVSFVGASYGIRAKLVSALEEAGIKINVYGKGWPNGRIPTNDVPELFAQSKIVLGCGAIGHCSNFLALKLRDFDGPMSGSLYITHDNPDLYPLFEEGKELVTFRTIPEAVEKVKYFLNSPKEMQNIAVAGRRRAFTEHTWARRFQLILTQLAKENPQ